MEADVKTRQEILDVLDDYAAAYSSKDVRRLLSHVGPDPDVVFIGTGRDEWVAGTAALREGMLRDMAQAETIRVAFRDVSVSRAGSVAWISCGLKFDVTVADGHVIIDGRFTALLEHRDYKWFFMQAHYSVPAEDQEVGHSYPLS